MRIRSVLAFGTGAAIGAGAMYLMDPELGPQRRREARRSALSQAREQATDLAGQLLQQGKDVALAAVQGYGDARESEPSTTR